MIFSSNELFLFFLYNQDEGASDGYLREILQNIIISGDFPRKFKIMNYPLWTQPNKYCQYRTIVGMVGILCLPLLVVLVPLYVLGRIIVWTGMLDGVDAW